VHRCLPSTRRRLLRPFLTPYAPSLLLSPALRGPFLSISRYLCRTFVLFPSATLISFLFPLNVFFFLPASSLALVSTSSRPAQLRFSPSIIALVFTFWCLRLFCSPKKTHLRARVPDAFHAAHRGFRAPARQNDSSSNVTSTLSGIAAKISSHPLFSMRVKDALELLTYFVQCLTRFSQPSPRSPLPIGTQLASSPSAASHHSIFFFPRWNNFAMAVFSFPRIFFPLPNNFDLSP